MGRQLCLNILYMGRQLCLNILKLDLLQARGIEKTLLIDYEIENSFYVPKIPLV